MSEGRALEWEDTIEKDESFTVIPEGKYDFEVVKVERGKFNGSAKIPAANMAIVTLNIKENGNVIGEVSENLIMHSKMEWKLSAFFRAIGQKKHGEKLVMDWPNVPASNGLCKVTIRKWKKEDGSEAESNQVDFLDPEEAAEAPVKAGWAK